MIDYVYPGTELAAFSRAGNWKRYVAARLRPWPRGDVLEVGAGLGSMTLALHPTAGVVTWLSLEPDPALAEVLRSRVRSLSGPAEVAVGTLGALDPARRFDCILYIDVLEHVPNDRSELAQAASRLRPGGVLIVLAPAFYWLSSPFDQAIGHYKRYDRETLRAAVPSGLREVRLCYLDLAGVLCSLANRWILRQRQVHAGELWVWDRLMVPVSRLLDPLAGYRVGRSILGIWETGGD